MAAVVTRKYADMERDFWNECQRLAELCFARTCQNVYDRLYLVGTKRKGLDTLNPYTAIWASFTVMTDSEHDTSDMILVHQDALPRHMTIDQLVGHFRELLRREPMWIFAD